MKRIRCDLGPVPYDGYDPKHMVGETVHMDVPVPTNMKAGASVCKIVDSWVTERPGLPSGEDDEHEPAPVQWLSAEIEVPDWIATLLSERALRAGQLIGLGGPVDKMLPVKPGSLNDAIDRALRREGYEDPGTVNRDALAYTRARYSQLVVKVPGGFSSRLRVQWARGIWRSLKSLWPDYLACLEGHFDVMEEEDRRAHCPHLEEWREPLDPEETELSPPWDICRACSKALRRDYPRIEYPSGTRR